MRICWLLAATMACSCGGESGSQGPPGEPGRQGEMGAQGAQGFTGPQGPAGTAARVISLIDKDGVARGTVLKFGPSVPSGGGSVQVYFESIGRYGEVDLATGLLPDATIWFDGADCTGQAYSAVDERYEVIATGHRTWGTTDATPLVNLTPQSQIIESSACHPATPPVEAFRAVEVQLPGYPFGGPTGAGGPVTVELR